MLDIEWDKNHFFPVARLSGEWSTSDVERVKASLGETAYGPQARLAIDLSGLKTIDSGGLGALIAVVTRSRMTDGRVVLVAPSPFVAGLLSTTRLDQWFDVCADLAEAESFLK